MFGKKKQPDLSVQDPGVEVHTIPTEFYAGNNPIVQFKNVTREISLSDGHVLSNADKKALDRASAPGRGQPLHPVHLFSNHRFLLIGAGIILLLAIAGAVAYYFFFLKSGIRPTDTPVNSRPPSGEIATATEAVVISPPPEIPTTTVTAPSLEESRLDLPSLLIGNTVDTDEDGLTDREEDLFSTDIGVPDSDQDKYTDAHEVFHLYNPFGKEPMKLAESNLVNDFFNPTFGYRLFYPKNWVIGALDSSNRQVLFTGITGEHVEVRVFDKSPNESFPDWFATHATPDVFGDLSAFSSVFGQSGFCRSDFLVYYFETPTRVYVLLYRVGTETSASYRSVIKMMARSFRLSDIAPTLIPDRPVEEGVPLSPTTTAPSSTSTSAAVSFFPTSTTSTPL